MSNETPTPPPSFLCQDMPGDTLHHIKCVLLVVQDSNMCDAACDDAGFGRHVIAQLCCEALEYEADRITDWRGRGEL